MSPLAASIAGAWSRTLGWLRANRWYVVGVLTAIATIQSLDRYVLIVAMEPVKREFGVSDAAMGSLAGLLFSLAYCVTALPLGFLADRLARVRLLSGLVFVWAGCTAAGALSRQYVTLVAARLLVGAAESGANPISGSLIADYFKPGQRAAPLGVMVLGGGLGAGLAFLLGALVIGDFGWRAAFLVAGIPGIALALITLLTVGEPRRGGLDGKGAGPAATTGWGASLRLFTSTPRYLLLCLGMGLASLTSSSYSTWVTSVMIRDHGIAIRHAGLIAAIGFGLVAAFSGAGIASIAQRLGRKRPERLAATAAVCVTAICGLGAGMIYCGDPRISLALFFLSCVALTGWTAPTYAMAVEAVPASSRAAALSVLTIIANIAAGLGPAAVGVLSDRLRDRDALGRALAIVLLADLLAAAAYLTVMANIMSARRGEARRAAGELNMPLSDNCL